MSEEYLGRLSEKKHVCALGRKTSGWETTSAEPGMAGVSARALPPVEAKLAMMAATEPRRADRLARAPHAHRDA